MLHFLKAINDFLLTVNVTLILQLDLNLRIDVCSMRRDVRPQLS